MTVGYHFALYIFRFKQKNVTLLIPTSDHRSAKNKQPFTQRRTWIANTNHYMELETFFICSWYCLFGVMMLSMFVWIDQIQVQIRIHVLASVAYLTIIIQENLSADLQNNHQLLIKTVPLRLRTVLYCSISLYNMMNVYLHLNHTRLTSADESNP